MWPTRRHFYLKSAPVNKLGITVLRRGKQASCRGVEALRYAEILRLRLITLSMSLVGSTAGARRGWAE